MQQTTVMSPLLTPGTILVARKAVALWDNVCEECDHKRNSVSYLIVTKGLCVVVSVQVSDTLCVLCHRVKCAQERSFVMFHYGHYDHIKSDVLLSVSKML